MAAVRAHEAAGRIFGQPAVAVTPVPGAVLRAEHPRPAFAIDHRQLAHTGPEGPRLDLSAAPFQDQLPVPRFGQPEGIDGHRASINGLRESPRQRGPAGGCGCAASPRREPGRNL